MRSQQSPLIIFDLQIPTSFHLQLLPGLSQHLQNCLNIKAPPIQSSHSLLLPGQVLSRIWITILLEVPELREGMMLTHLLVVDLEHLENRVLVPAF